MRKVSQAGVNLIKLFEGFRAKPYICAAGKPTIGFGTTVYPDNRKVSLNDPEITKEQAEGFLMYDLSMRSKALTDMIKVPLNDNEYAALACFVYNIGIGAFKNSTMRKLLNAGEDKKVVAEQFLRWNKAGGKVLAGLTRRREAEKNLFLLSDEETYLSEEPSEEDINVKLEDIENEVL